MRGTVFGQKDRQTFGCCGPLVGAVVGPGQVWLFLLLEWELQPENGVPAVSRVDLSRGRRVEPRNSEMSKTARFYEVRSITSYLKRELKAYSSTNSGETSNERENDQMKRKL